jgi:drug/metabolite transporter (DMT)-like permease
MHRQRQAVLLTLLVVLFWGTAASAFKIALRQVSPYTLLVWAAAVSTGALFLILLGRGQLGRLRTLPRPVLLRAALLGLLNPFLYYLVLFKAYSLLPGQIAMALNYGWPLVLTLLSVPILRQRLSRGQLAAVGVSFVGAVLIATRGQLTHFGGLSGTGLLLAAGSTLLWALFWLGNARIGADPVVKLFVGFCSGLIAALVCSLPPTTAWPALVYIGLFEMGLTFVLWLSALQLATTTARITNLVYLTPFLSLCFLRLVIGEPIHPATATGLALIVLSLLFQEYRTRRA